MCVCGGGGGGVGEEGVGLGGGGGVEESGQSISSPIKHQRRLWTHGKRSITLRD